MPLVPVANLKLIGQILNHDIATFVLVVQENTGNFFTHNTLKKTAVIAHFKASVY